MSPAGLHGQIFWVKWEQTPGADPQYTKEITYPLRPLRVEGFLRNKLKNVNVRGNIKATLLSLQP